LTRCSAAHIPQRSGVMPLNRFDLHCERREPDACLPATTTSHIGVLNDRRMRMHGPHLIVHRPQALEFGLDSRALGIAGRMHVEGPSLDIRSQRHDECSSLLGCQLNSQQR